MIHDVSTRVAAPAAKGARFAVVLAVLASGCASVRQIRVESMPPGAKVQLDGAYVGDAPIEFDVSFTQKDEQWTTHSLKLSLEEYEEYRSEITLYQLPDERRVNVKKVELARIRHALKLQVKSNPPGAQVLVNGTPVGPAGGKPIEFVFTRATARDPWSTFRIGVRLNDYEDMEQELVYEQVAGGSPISFAPARLRHMVEVPIKSTPTGAQILVDGSPTGAKTDGKIKLSFSRATSADPWKPIQVGVRLKDYEDVEGPIAYEQATGGGALSFQLGRVQWVLPLTVTCNVEDAEVRIGDEVVGQAPCTLELNFRRVTADQPWDAVLLSVRKENYVHLVKQADGKLARHESFQARLTPEAVEGKPELPVKLERMRWKEINVPVYVDTDKGPVFGQKLVRAYLEDIEKEPKVKSVTKVTSYHPRILIACRIDVMPDSETIVYMVPQQAPASQVMLSNLWVKKALEDATTRLTAGNYTDINPGVSAQGDFLYFRSTRLQKPTLWRISVKGKGGLTKITDSAAWDDWPSVSPDGKKIAYVSRLRAGTPAHIWVANADGTLPTQLREGTMPDWSPNGKRIAYVAADPATGNNKLWIMGGDGSDPTQITSLPESDEQCPTWMPNGRQLIFSSNRARDEMGSPNYDIWVTNADGTGQTQLTVNGSDDLFPSVSPNGAYVYFYSYRGARTEIWRIEIMGEDERAGEGQSE